MHLDLSRRIAIVIALVLQRQLSMATKSGLNFCGRQGALVCFCFKHLKVSMGRAKRQHMETL